MRALVLSSMLTIALAVVVSDAAAKSETKPPPPMPVSVTMVGPKSVRVRVSVGTTFPCDSTANTPLFEGKVPAGWTATWVVSASAVCLEQTNESFPDVGWSQPWLEWRPMHWTPWGTWERSNDPIVVTLTSTPPPD